MITSVVLVEIGSKVNLQTWLPFHDRGLYDLNLDNQNTMGRLWKNDPSISRTICSVISFSCFLTGVAYDANHPFHLHGHPFRVVAMERVGKNITREEVMDMDAKGLIHRNLDSAPLKDTVTVPDGGFTIIRFHATNPGTWNFITLCTVFNYKKKTNTLLSLL